MKEKRGAVPAEERPDAIDREVAPAGEERREEPHSPEEIDAELERLRAREEELLRALAEMTNVQRRRKQETEQTVRYAQESLVRELLPVLDDFERALAAMPGEPGDPFRAGIELVRDRMIKILERQGVVAIRAAGEPFDPNLHDAIGERAAPPGSLPGMVLDVAQTGYLLGERVLRHAKVIVAGQPVLAPTPPTMQGGGIPRPPDTIPPPLEERERDSA